MYKFLKKIKKITKNNKHSKIFKVKDNVFTEKINKIALSSNDDKRMQSIDSTETYAHGTSKDLVHKKQEIKCNKKKIQNCLTLIVLEKKT